MNTINPTTLLINVSLFRCNAPFDNKYFYIKPPLMNKRSDIIFLFDVDGTLSASRDKSPPEILNMLRELKKRVTIAFVGGSDLSKQIEQIGPELLQIFDYGFPENGVQFYKEGKLVSSSSVVDFLGENNYKRLINKILLLLSETESTVKRGTFIELRQSMINVSPIGRTCTREERNEFFELDKTKKIRQKLCDDLKGLCDELNIQCSIGGQISIDIFPKGWDKTYCLRHIKEKKVYFFGDMTMEGGNDYEIFNHERVTGTTVNGPKDTIKKVNERLKENEISEIQY